MKIGVIGLGLMGAAMVKKLLEAGHELTINNRTKTKADPLVALGACWAGSPAEAATGADVIISIVTDPKAVSEVALGTNGILSALSPNAVYTDMSTVGPDSATTIAEQFAKAGKRFVQAPVLGSHQQIASGALLVLAGGAPRDVELCKGPWDAFAKRVWTLDSPEQACALKLACNMMIANMIIGLGQSLTFSRLFGIDGKDFVDVISESALAAPMYRAKGDAILAGAYKPSFVVANLLKDVHLANDSAQARGRVLPVNPIASQLLERATAAGFADEDYSAVVKILATDANVTLF